MRSVQRVALCLSLWCSSGAARADKLVLPVACQSPVFLALIGQGQVTLGANGDLSGVVKLGFPLVHGDMEFDCTLSCGGTPVASAVCGEMPSGRNVLRVKAKKFAPGAVCSLPSITLSTPAVAFVCTPQYDQTKP
jgi:hypothetical protein